MIAIASDHGGFELKKAIVAYFEENNIEYVDYGTDSAIRSAPVSFAFSIIASDSTSFPMSITSKP